MMKKKRINRPHLPINRMAKVIVAAMCLMTYLVVSCKMENGFKTREGHIVKLIDYLKKNEVDSIILDQPFFNASLKSRKNPFNMYLVGLKEMQRQVRGSNSYIINLESEVDKEDVLSLVLTPSTDSKRIYFLVREDGIESFSPLIKGDKIVSWM